MAKGFVDHYRSDNDIWPMISQDIKGYHSVGRTVPRMVRYGFHEEIDELLKTYTPRMIKNGMWGWNALGVGQKLDLIATEMLRVDENRVAMSKFSDRRYILSVGQWSERHHKEIPMTLEEMTALITKNDRCTLYRGSTTERPPMSDRDIERHTSE